MDTNPPPTGDEDETMTLEIAAEMLADACAYSTFLINTLRNNEPVDENQWDNARDANNASLRVYWELAEQAISTD